MAFAGGQEVKEVEVELLSGVAAAKVLAVNPTRAEKNKILDQDFTNEEIKYLGETVVKDADNKDKNVPQVRVDILMQTDPEIACNNGMEKTFTVSFFIAKAANYAFKEEGTKVQVIDKYGRTAWVTTEQAKNKVVPEYIIRKEGPNKGKTMKAAICPDYRPAYIGEADLVQFMIALIGIPRPDVWNDEKKVFEMKTDPKELAKSEAGLDDIKKYFEGNVSEVRKIVGFQPKNRVKLLLGVRTANNGAQYQAVYTQRPLKLNVTNYKTWEEDLQADKKAGRHPNVVYKVQNLCIFKAEATNYAEQEAPKNNDPFAAQNQQAEKPQEEEKTPVEKVVEGQVVFDPFASM